MCSEQAEFRQTLDQLARTHRTLVRLQEEVLPVNPQAVALLAEGPLDYIRQLHEAIEAYRLSLVAGSTPGNP